MKAVDRAAGSQVVPKRQGLLCLDTLHQVGELEADDLTACSEVYRVPVDLGAESSHQLGTLHHGDHGPVARYVAHLEPGQPLQGVVETPPEALQRLQRLVGLGHELGRVLQLVPGLTKEDGGRPAVLTHRHHRLLCLDRDPLGGAMAGARLLGSYCRRGDEMDVGPEDAGAVVAQDDRSVHLG